MADASFSGPMENVTMFHAGPMPVTRILVMSWLVMGLIVVGAAVVRARLRRRDPGRMQSVVEAMLDWLGAEIRGIINRDPWPFIPLVASLFLFILASNFVSFISSFFTFLTPPTADLNTTAALATIVFLAVPFYGVAMSGALRYLKTYVEPVWIMLPFNIISDLSRTLAMAVRLFGNIVSGEILFGVIVALVPFFLLPLGTLPLMFLGLITGTIQAYIFAVLTIVYIGGAVKVVEKHQKEEPSS